MSPRDRFVGTPNLTKHRFFAFLEGHVCPDHALIAFTRSDDYFFGVLHSLVHELWARRMGTPLRAVPAAYAAVDPAGGWSPEWAEVWVETGSGQPLAGRRAEVDQQVLGALLRLNLARAGVQ